MYLPLNIDQLFNKTVSNVKLNRIVPGRTYAVTLKDNNHVIRTTDPPPPPAVPLVPSVIKIDTSSLETKYEAIIISLQETVLKLQDVVTK